MALKIYCGCKSSRVFTRTSDPFACISLFARWELRGGCTLHMRIASTIRYRTPRTWYPDSYELILSLPQLFQLRTCLMTEIVQRTTTLILSQRWRSTVAILIMTHATMIRPLGQHIHRTRMLWEVPFWPCPSFSHSIEVSYTFDYYIHMRLERAIVASEPPFSFVSHYSFGILYNEQRYMYVC